MMIEPAFVPIRAAKGMLRLAVEVVERQKGQKYILHIPHRQMRLMDGAMVAAEPAGFGSLLGAYLDEE